MRKELDIELDDRGTPKKFHITEMPPIESARWAVRLVKSAAAGAAELPDDIAAKITAYASGEKAEEAADMGLGGLVHMGFSALAHIPDKVVEDFMDRLLMCVKFYPDAKDARIMRDLMEEDIDDFKTILKLQKAVWDLHTDFIRPAKK